MAEPVAIVNCRDCKHWNPDATLAREGKRPCRLVSHSIYGYRYGDPIRSKLAETHGDFGNESELWTDGAFGCIQGERKE